jgi:hypothetical protein
MSASVQQAADPWDIVEHEAPPPPAPPPAPAPAPVHPDVIAHTSAAFSAAHNAKTSADAADAAAKEAQMHRSHMDARKAEIDSAHAAVMAALGVANELADRLGQMMTTQQEQMLAAFAATAEGMRGIVAEMQKPRRVKVTKRDRDGGISEAISEVRKDA